MSASFAMLLADTARSRAYLDAVAGAGLQPERVLIVDCPAVSQGAAERIECPWFENREPVAERCRTLGFRAETVQVDRVNDPTVAECVAALQSAHLVYSGPPGVLLGPDLLDAGCRIIHVHAGRLPEFRGSTTMYYALLAEGVMWVTAIFLDRRIDHGGIIAQRCFEPPADRAQIDNGFDPWMRASLLADVLTTLVDEGGLEAGPQPGSDELPYYVIHPVLKHLAILAGPDQS